MRRLRSSFYAVNLPDAITLGGAHDRDGASPVYVYRVTFVAVNSISLQQQQWRMLFELKAEVADSQHVVSCCTKLAGDGPMYVFLKPKL